MQELEVKLNTIREYVKVFNCLNLWLNMSLDVSSLPAIPYELAEWKQATVQFNYHVSVDGILYSVPYEYIKRKVDVRIIDKTLEIFYNHNRIASQRRLYGRKGQYSTVVKHMSEDHQKYTKKECVYLKTFIDYNLGQAAIKKIHENKKLFLK